MTAGPRRGRPLLCRSDVLDRAVQLRTAGLSYRAIADRLNAEELPTPAGQSPWRHSHVYRLLGTSSARELLSR
ncbi:recombinase family protein [Nocardia nova]|uniref:recombinase family protein n=1 Tax=Nocardia nova TaxID=37330 RepID=UPI0015E32EF7